MGRGRDFRGGGNGRKRQGLGDEGSLHDFPSISLTNLSHQKNASSASRPRRVEPNLAEAKGVFGKVKWFSAEKGIGFVEAEDGGKDIFVHITVVKKGGFADLSEGQRILMQVTETAKGRQAVAIEAVG